jgi:hypothetical protein
MKNAFSSIFLVKIVKNRLKMYLSTENYDINSFELGTACTFEPISDFWSRMNFSLIF